MKQAFSYLQTPQSLQVPAGSALHPLGPQPLYSCRPRKNLHTSSAAATLAHQPPSSTLSREVVILFGEGVEAAPNVPRSTEWGCSSSNCRMHTGKNRCTGQQSCRSTLGRTSTASSAEQSGQYPSRVPGSEPRQPSRVGHSTRGELKRGRQAHGTPDWLRCRV